MRVQDFLQLQVAGEECGYRGKERDVSWDAGCGDEMRVPHSNSDLASYPASRIPHLQPAIAGNPVSRIHLAAPPASIPINTLLYRCTPAPQTQIGREHV